MAAPTPNARASHGRPSAAVARRRRIAAAGSLVAAFFVIMIIVVASGGGPDSRRAVVDAYAAGWAKGDWAQMHAQLSPAAKSRVPLLEFARAHRGALAIASAGARGVQLTGEPQAQGDTWLLPVAIRTRLFGTVRGSVVLPIEDTPNGPRIAWQPHLVFPGLRPGEELERRTRLLARGTLLARDATVLAQGADRSSPVPDVAGQVVGRLGPIPPEDQVRATSLGVPADASVGVSGLERLFDAQLTGIPAGTLIAGGRTIVRSVGRPGATVKTTISPPVERAAIAALAGRYGGAVALDPRTGAVLAYAGAAFSLVQPPGSTFKIITAAAALQARTATPTSSYAFATAADVRGTPIANAAGELCGGTLVQAFAASCNSVFAPLGIELGARRMVAAAEAFGFNRPPALPIAATSRFPAAALTDDLAVGSASIGQGQVEATTLQMAETAGIIARRGVRAPLTLSYDREQRARGRRGRRVIPERVARQIERMMLAVVRSGTGYAAALPRVSVAGKTGTAELRSRKAGDTTVNPEDTDAWFVAFAPAGGRTKPRIVVGVLLGNAGASKDTAAPAARLILQAGLRRD
ncbi:MAG: hypothetical protein F2832_07830 [Actinobacteria bacterium]|nr:hypothetical protein [Actinomycetota bacterium]